MIELIGINPVVLVWFLLLANWIGTCSAYLNAKESKAYAKVMGIVLLLTGILMLGIRIGKGA